jgi:putative tributyrin esterase
MTRRRNLLIALALTVTASAGAGVWLWRDVTNQTFASAALKRDMPYRVILPDGYDSGTARYPVLYLLHGHGGSYWNWTERTYLLEHARTRPLIIVMPEGENSWYVNGNNGDWHSYVTVDLVADVDRKFRTIASREGRMIAGLSMGGYGSVIAGLKSPDLFSLIGSFSGAFDITRPNDVFHGFERADVLAVFGPIGSPVRQGNDVYTLAAAADPAKTPVFWIAVGTEDAWLEPNRELVRVMKSRKLKYEYHETPGNHEWPYWNRAAKSFLELAVAQRAGGVEPHRPDSRHP